MSTVSRKAYQLIVLSVNSWDVGIVGVRDNILKLFTGEDIYAKEMNFGLPMLARTFLSVNRDGRLQILWQCWVYDEGTGNL